MQLVLGLSHEQKVGDICVYLGLCCSPRVQRVKDIQAIAGETINIPGEALTIKRDGEEFVGNGVTNVNQLRLRRSQLKDRGDESEVGRLMTLSELGSASTGILIEPASQYLVGSFSTVQQPV